MRSEAERPAGLDSLSPSGSGQWQGFSSPSLIRPGHESRTAVLGGVLALVGFCLPLIGVQYQGAAAPLLFSGPQLVEIFPQLWAVPLLAGLVCLIAIREPERRGRALVGLLALAAFVPLVLGIASGYASDTKSGISRGGFFGTLDHLEAGREAAYRRVYEDWQAKKQAAKKADTEGLEGADDVGDLDDLDEEEDESPKEALEPSGESPAPARPAEPVLSKSGLTVGFYLLLLGLAMAWSGSWPWTEEALAWFERVALVVLLLLMLVLAGLPVLVHLDSDKKVFTGIDDTTWMIRLSRMSVVWVGLIGASLATRERGHIAIEVLDRIVPKTVCAWLKVCTSVFAVAVLLFLCAAASDYVQLKRASLLASLLTETTPPPPYVEVQRWGIALKEWVFTLIFPIGLFVLALRFALLGGQDLLGVKFDHHYGEPL